MRHSSPRLCLSIWFAVGSILLMTTGCNDSDSGSSGGGSPTGTGIIRVDLASSSYEAEGLTVTDPHFSVPSNAAWFRIYVKDPTTFADLVSAVEVRRSTLGGSQIVEIAGVRVGPVVVLVEVLDASWTIIVTASATATVVEGLNPIPIVVRSTPTISSVTPSTGPLAGGTTISIRGTNFFGTISVSIGGVAASGVTVNTTHTAIACTTPAGTSAGSKNVVVTSSTNGSATLTGGFVYASPMTVTGVGPTYGSALGGQTVSVTGTNFPTDVSTVTLGVTTTAATRVSSTLVRCSAPAGSGTVGVTVTSPTLGTAALPNAYTYYGTMTVEEVSPTSGPAAGGTTVSVTGTNFPPDVTTVTFGVTATTATRVSSTRVTCTAPAGSGTVGVTVTSLLLGSSGLADCYTYNPVMTVTGVTPNSGPLEGNINVTVTGTNLPTDAAVAFGTSNATVTGVSGTNDAIRCVIPPGSGTVGVTVTSATFGVATLASAFTYAAAPSIETPLYPQSGPLSDSSNVTIQGYNLVGTTPKPQVQFGNDWVDAEVVDPLSGVISCTKPSIGSTGSVTVTVSTQSGDDPLQCGFMVNPNLTAFTERVTPTSAGAPNAVAVGDFNRDGYPDLVTANTTSNCISVFLTAGGGGVGVPYAVTVGATPTAVAVGDFRQNGNLQLAVANLGSDEVSILRNNGSGTFTTNTTVTGTVSPTAVVVGDFTGDGYPDLAVTHSVTSGTVSVLVNDGTGGFTESPTRTSVGVYPVALGVSDFDRDGKRDLAVVSRNSGTLSILFGDGTGGFSPTRTVTPTVGTSPTAISVEDLNRDGYPDLVVANAGSQSLSILLGSSGGFSSPATVTLGFVPSSVALGDLNGDGVPEIVVSDEATPRVHARIGTGLGTFLTTGVDLSSGTKSARALALADMNGDGRPDVVAANASSEDVSVLTNPVSWVGRGTPSFVVATPVSSSGFNLPFVPLSLAAGDLDCNGHLDLVVPYQTANTVQVLLGKGIGRFETTNVSVSSGGVTPQALGVADFDGDTIPDVIVANADARALVLLGNGTGEGWKGSQSLTVGATPTAVAIGTTTPDVVAERARWIVVSNQGAKTLTPFVVGATGNVSASPSVDPGEAPEGLAVGDFNRDGIPDVAVAMNDLNQVLLYTVGYDPTGNVTLSDTPIVLNCTTSPSPTVVAVGDFNHDSWPDVAVASHNSTTLLVFLNNGSGAFPGVSSSPALGATVEPTSIVAADVDRDGHLDLVVTDSANDSVILMRNNSGGTFTSAGTWSVGAAAVRAVVGDFNGDGLPDVAVANPQTTNGLSVLLGQ